MIRTALEVIRTLMLRVLRRLARMQIGGHLVFSLKAARHGYEKRQRGRKQAPVAWKLSSSIWELRFCWRWHRSDQRSGPPNGQWATSRKARSASAKTGRQSSGSLWQGVPNCLTRRRMTASNDTLAVGK